jgi:nucleoside-diphosphate-sugar epimerase
MLIPLKGRRVTIIGGAGFIGHNLALSLVEQGAEVEIIDSLQVNNLAWLASNPDFINRDMYLKIVHERLDFLRSKGIEVIIQDARDYSALNRLLHVLNPQVIVHLAAVSHAGRSNKDPYSTFDHSLRTLENALDSARGNVEHFIYFSSSMVYGNFLTEEVTEEHPLNPIGIYGALKLAGEKMVIAYQQVFDLPYTIIRPSALYGPRCVSRRVGQVFIENALQGTNLRIEGDGQEKLDFTYIQDLVEAISTVIQNPKARNEIFNMTYGQSRSINELAQIVQSHFPNVTIDYIERDNLMPIRGTLLVDKAKELLDYTPSYPIDIGMPEYIQWYRDFFEKFKT